MSKEFNTQLINDNIFAVVYRKQSSILVEISIQQELFWHVFFEERIKTSFFNSFGNVLVLKTRIKEEKNPIFILINPIYSR